MCVTQRIGTAVVKSDLAPCSHIRNVNFFQLTAIFKRIFLDTGKAARNRDTGQAATVIERLLTDTGHAVRNGHRGKVLETVKGIVLYGGNSLRHCNRGNQFSFQKNIICLPHGCTSDLGESDSAPCVHVGKEHIS